VVGGKPSDGSSPTNRWFATNHKQEPQTRAIGQEGATPPNPPRRDEPTADFLAFWNGYPDGHGTQGKAWRAWRTLAPDAATVAAIMAGLAAWTGSDRWRRGYVVNADRFLRERRWEDPPPPAPEPPARPGGRSKRGQSEWVIERFAELEKRQP
jgi:hypothetical protein